MSNQLLSFLHFYKHCRHFFKNKEIIYYVSFAQRAFENRSTCRTWHKCRILPTLILAITCTLFVPDINYSTTVQIYKITTSVSSPMIDFMLYNKHDSRAWKPWHSLYKAVTLTAKYEYLLPAGVDCFAFLQRRSDTCIKCVFLHLVCFEHRTVTCMLCSFWLF